MSGRMGRLCMLASLVSMVLADMRDVNVAGHLGVMKTTGLDQHRYSWPSLWGCGGCLVLTSILMAHC